MVEVAENVMEADSAYATLKNGYGLRNVELVAV